MIVRNFEYLIALNREGHFGRAAKSCNVSQPTLSAGIKQLEKDLDAQIVRHGKRYDGLTKEDEIAKFPLCLLNSAIPRIAQTQLSQCERAIYTDSLDVLVAHLASGKYSSVLPQSLASRLKQISHLQALAVTGPGSQASVGFVATKRGFESTTSNALLEMIHAPELASSIQSLLAVHRGLRPKIADSNQADK